MTNEFRNMPDIAQDLDSDDIFVITALWSIKFIDNLLAVLVGYTSVVMYGDAVESESFREFSVLLLFFKCGFVVVVGFLVDAYNHRFEVTCGGIGSFFLTTASALCMCLTQKLFFARATLAVSSILFVTSPAAFALIFNQKHNPVRGQVRRLVSIMEFTEGMMIFIMHEAISGEANYSGRLSTIITWIVVFSLITLSLTFLGRVRLLLSEETVKERGVMAIFKGLSDDIRGFPPRTGLNKTHVLFFVLLLVPAFSLTSMESIISNLKVGNHTQSQNPALRRTISFAQLTVIPLTEVAVTFVPIKESVAEMLVLGLAHIANIAVMTLLVIMTSKSAERSAAIIYVNQDLMSTTYDYTLVSHPTTDFASRKVQDPGNFSRKQQLNVSDSERSNEQMFLSVIVNTASWTVALQDDPLQALLNDLDTHLGPSAGIVTKHVHISENQMTIKLTITTPDDPVRSKFSKSFNFKVKRAYLIVLKPTDYVVSFTEIPDPDPVPLLVVWNTFVGSDVYANAFRADHEVRIITGSGRTILSELFLPNYTKSLELKVPQGLYTFEVRYNGTDSPLQQLAPSRTEIFMEPASVNFIVISMYTEVGYRYGISRTIQYNEKTPTPTIPKTGVPPKEPSAVEYAAFAMIGATLGITSVGYIHFFWMESPVRLRATLYAWFLASNQILGWVASHVIGNELGFKEGIALLVLAIATGVWHFSLGWYFDHKFRPDPYDDGKEPQEHKKSTMEDENWRSSF